VIFPQYVPRWQATVFASGAQRLGQLAALILLLLLSANLFATQIVDSVRLHRAPDHTRIVFDLKGPVEHRLFRLNEPERIVLDLEQTDVQFSPEQLNLGDSPVTGIRIGRHEDQRARIVFDLRASVRPRTNLLRPIEPHGWRLVLDLFDNEPRAPAKVDSSPQSAAQARPMVIAIDAGHGGEDPGALGPSGTREKDVVLQIARHLHRLMQREAGLQPVLIRTGDYYVPLVERRRRAAETHQADAFISIHADAFTDPRANGASVFALSTRGATSARARYLAQIANDSDRVAGVYEAERSNSGLLNVLADLKMHGTLTESLYLGRQVMDELAEVTRLHGDRRKVEQAGFVVLKEPGMLSILVETGFISNRTEERNLTSSAHQEKLAQAILTGVRRYFEQHPKPGSWQEAQRYRAGSGNVSHRIEPGETLSGIARRYSVSENAIRSQNNLRGDHIRAGQTLVIPQ